MNESPPTAPDEQPGWFDQPANVRKLIIALVVVCAGLLAAELFYTNPHPHFEVEQLFGFHALIGFVAFVTVVILGKVLRLFVRRPEDYYDS